MKVLIATDKPIAKVAVDGIRKEIEAAGFELALLEKYTEKAQLLDAVKDENESLKKEIQSLKDANAVTEQKLADATSEDVVNALLQKKLDLVKEVTELCDADIDFTKSDIEIKRCALEAAFDKSFKDKDDDYINIRYRIMKEEGVPAVGQKTGQMP